RAHRAALAPGVNPKTNRGRSTATNSPHRSRAWAGYRTSLRRVRIDHCEEPEDDRANERGRLGNASVPRRVLSDLGHREKHERLLTPGTAACPRALPGHCRPRIPGIQVI